MKNKFISLAFAGFIAFNPGIFPRLNTSVKLATDSAESPSPMGSPRGLRGIFKQEIKEDLGKIKATRAWLKGVKITAIGSNSITVDNSGTSVTVNIESNTQLRRRFWGKSELTEMSVGDSVTVVGKWADDSKTSVNAVLIRDESIQKRNGVFFGTVKSLTTGGFVFTTIHKGDETVTIGSAKLINRKGETITASDIKVGDRIRVRGLWDSNTKTITEVKEIKNFSLPPKPSGSPEASPKT